MESPKTTESIINDDALEAIRALDPNGGNELLKRIIKLYYENTETLLQSLEQAWDKGDIEGIRSASHTLKSSSSQVGIHSLTELCREVENEARNHQYDTTGEALAKIKQEFKNARAALNDYL